MKKIISDEISRIGDKKYSGILSYGLTRESVKVLKPLVEKLYRP